MKRVYTLYVAKDPAINGNFCGYNSSEDLFNMLLLSSISSAKHFDKCELYCSKRGYEMLKKDGRPFPFTDIIVCFDDLETWLMPHNWAYPKIITYSMQEEPFVHIDCDAIICDGLPPALLQMKFIFQQKELLSSPRHPFYRIAYNDSKNLGILPEIITELPAYGMCMGLFGCIEKDWLFIVKAYCETIRLYLLKQQKVAGELTCSFAQPHLFEQLFISSFLQAHSLKENKDFGTFLTDNLKNKFYPSYRFSHFLAEHKRSKHISYSIKKELIQLGLYNYSRQKI